MLALDGSSVIPAVIPLEIGEAAQLGLHLAVFGRDEEMPRSRSVAEKLATAIELAHQAEREPLRLSSSQQRGWAPRGVAAREPGFGGCRRL